MNEPLASIVRIIENNPRVEFWLRTETMNELLSNGTVHVEGANLVITIEGCVITVETGLIFNIEYQTCYYYRLKSIKGLYNTSRKPFDTKIL